jgi:pimeloyl-ACP methyl ester carboxylesterase
MRPLVVALALALCATAQAATVDVRTKDGLKLVVDVDGPEAGEPVLLLHGLAASSATNWRLPGITRALTDAGFRVIAPDQRGHGRSDAPGDGSYGPVMVDDALAVLDALGVQKAHVVGYSMGGLVGLRLAALAPTRVRSLLLGGMGWLESGSRGQRVFGLAMRRAGRGPATVACAAQLSELALSEDELGRVEAPVGLVVGELDPARFLVDRLHAARAAWPVEVVPGVGHLGCVLSDALRAAVVAHVRRYSSI